MNKIFKVIWNRTTQSLVVTSELAKGQVKSSSDASAPTVSSQVGKLFKLSAVALATLGVVGQVNAAVTAPLNNIAVIAGTRTVAVGGATADGIGSVALGAGASAKLNGAAAFGSGAAADGNNAIAISANAKATGGKAIAIGSDANASVADALAFGHAANASASDAVALGHLVNATAANATAIGGFANANAESAVAIGRTAVVSKD